MLIDFTATNYASLRDETTLSAETGARLRKFKKTNTFQNEKIPVLKSILLFGPNGAGKSQLIDALGHMQGIIVNPTGSVTDKLPYDPFLLDDNSREKPTTFEVTVEIKGIIYKYSFSYIREKIVSEKLIIISSVGKEIKKIFSRLNDNVETDDKNLIRVLPTLRDNSLLLYLAQAENNRDAVEVFTWFSEDLLFLSTTTTNTTSLLIPKEMLDLMNDKHLKKEMITFLKFADFNIKDIKIREVPATFSTADGENITRTMTSLYTVRTCYDGSKNIGEQELNLAQESRGTQRLFYIVLAMIFAQVNGNKKTLVIDEFDDSLHYELAKTLITLFNSEENLNQFIITTHDVQLLDNSLRIDQIYLIDKDFRGVTSLNSVFDFSDTRNTGRADLSFARKYILGRFGAYPIIDAEKLKNILKATHDNYNGGTNGKK
ncbi:ATP-binding protein [Lactobacillus sp. PV037]|uniref:AAA family ATPase n=1 Tax=Lactobacillus sp. PV037 TaxID=2594496 RepID=UPI00223FCDBD|nr:ATP-binding protein [Lactobacillus sp. PV037]QNQ83771.1 ATP-binding protein [Lactobacillus sp. PV037]